MKVLIMTLGTRGDVQPFVALARGLLAAGHEVVLTAPHRFAGFVTSHGVPFTGVDDGPMRLMDDTAGAGAVIEGGIRARLRQARTMPAMFTQLLEDCWVVASRGAGAGADLVVHNGQILAGQHVAEALGIPAVLALPVPMYVPTREFPWPGAGFPPWLPASANRATFLGMKAPVAMFGRVVDRWREHTLRLPRRRRRHDPLRRPDNDQGTVLHAFSPAVLHAPADWPDSVRTTGYWVLPPSSEPLPDRVEEFLSAGDPPVFVGFGSMSGRDPAHSTAVVLEAARRAGTRLVMATGWGGLADSAAGDDVLVVNEVDHQLLFPRVAAVVHHGGAGTSGVAFAAGRPQVVCPFVGDQPFWARLAHRRGVAPEPLPQRHLTPSGLAAAITTAITDSDLARTAEQLGRCVRADHGVGDAVTALEGVALAHRPT
ncbi:glycosyltransferase [Actinocrispum wychmicini]|uniref:Sterol 3beta-glucosyltransferase n=1 Tax=Actinocrispum wychmicini TaxID=1213861 RepID=A0A4V6NNW8_9PSEU|nr:glycosyltransferase [Actinocrispum wychmicini]TCO58320.1 sterol 3beta-glucosyltransferase [Actinocrispum wychmicini]